MALTGNKNLNPGRSSGATSPAPGWGCGALGAVAWEGWDAHPVWHGFLRRHSDDGQPLDFSPDSEAQRRNWHRLRQHFEGAPELTLVRQVHGNQVHVAAAGNRVRREGDGQVSATPGLILGILTADCVPLLMLDPQAQVVAAIHAGWRGVMAEIATAGVARMLALGARRERIQALLGPAIGWCCFEVDRELAERFALAFPNGRERAREGGPGKAFLDLHGLLSDQLCRAGLPPQGIHRAPHCTRCESAQFFSRRAAGGTITGLQLSFIGVRG